VAAPVLVGLVKYSRTHDQGGYQNDNLKTKATMSIHISGENYDQLSMLPWAVISQN
jgi:hypothetical protein